jgi:2-hydroxychromene-2-carboxylate isomerase
LAANQQVGSVEIEAKRAYVFKHALRLAAQHGLKLNVPCHHPFKSLLALRVTALSSPSTRPLLVEGLFRAARLLEQDLADPAVVKQCLANAGEAPELLATAAQEPAKAAVRDNTDAALAAGVFGVPTFGYAGELFWGCDSIPHLADALDGYTQVDPSLHERWQRLARS